MTDDDNNHEPDDEEDDGDTSEVDLGLGGLFGSIGELIEALSEIDQNEDGTRSETGRVDRDSFTIDYNYDVNVGIGGDRDRRSRSRDHSSEPERTVDVDDFERDPEYEVDVREYEDEVIVSADLPGVDEEDLDITVEDDEGAVTIEAANDVIERIPLDDQLSVTDVSFKNQILQIRLQHTESSNDE